MNSFYTIVILLFILLIGACGTTDSTMRKQGLSDSYIQGFHDGRHSGMKEEGNHYEHYIRDETSFKSDNEYRKGWIAGEIEGKRLQDEAVKMGNAIGGTYSGAAISKEVKKNRDFDKTAKDVLKNTDTSGLKSLEK